MSAQEGINRRVLIADDQTEIHKDFEEILSPDGAYLAELDRAFNAESQEGFLPEFEIVHAQSGEKACEALCEGLAAGKPIAVAFVDIRMPPGIDGVETARRLHALDERLEIVLMTAYTDKSLREILKGAGIPHRMLYIRKPFSREEIQQLTLSLTGKWNLQATLEHRRELLEESHHNLRAVLEGSRDAMALYTAENRLGFANSAYRALFGLSSAELEARSRESLQERFITHAVQPRGGGRLLTAVGGDEKAKHPRQLYYESVSEVSNSGKALGTLVVYRDVSLDLEIEAAKAQVAELRRQLGKGHAFGGLIGQSPKMQALYGLMERALDTDVSVLIGGESGTGKELVARALHEGGGRHSGPFVAVNCAAVPEGLIESELFGHEKGAFTGASRRHFGAFERASGGTLFLDEVGDMPLGLQAKLLRVLQEREVQPLGASKPFPVDVRIVAASNRDLRETAEKGAFRSDLYFRLAVFPMTLPPLRERSGDVALLAGHFLARFKIELKTPAGSISGAALAALVSYTWPGNVRELENTIQRACLVETGASLRVESLPAEVLEGMRSRNELRDLTLEAAERRAIQQALALSTGSVPAAAKLLGTSRSALYRKMARHGLRAID